jgi:hypothetical protein
MLTGLTILFCTLPVGMVLEGSLSKGLFDFSFRGISGDTENFPWIVSLVHYLLVSVGQWYGEL